MAHLDSVPCPDYTIRTLKDTVFNLEHKDNILKIFIAGGEISRINSSKNSLKEAARKESIICQEIISSSFALNTRNGKIYSTVKKSQLDHGKKIEERQAYYFWRTFVRNKIDININFQPQLAMNFTAKAMNTHERALDDRAFKNFWGKQLNRAYLTCANNLKS